MLSRIVGVLLGSVLFASGASMLVVQFSASRGAQTFGTGMGIAVLIGGAAAVIACLRPRR